MAIEGRFGIGDPYRMGIIASMLYSIWPEQAENIELDYVNWAGEGSGHIKGRIILAVMAWHGTRFYYLNQCVPYWVKVLASSGLNGRKLSS